MRITSRIALVLCVVVVLSAGTVAAMIFWRLNATLVESKLNELERETEVQSTHFVDQINELTRDTLIVAGTPPVQGIIRAIANDGVDPHDQSKQAVWEDRLATIFTEVLEHKPNYLQIRYIGLADGGRELVRLDRGTDPSGPAERVTDDDLQQKMDEPYFQQTLKQAAGAVYLSDINLNRERGRIQTPHAPVIRAAVAVRSATGKIFGIIVINYLTDDLFDRLVHVANPDHTYYIIDDRNNYLRHPQPRYSMGFEFGESRPASTDFPLIDALLNSARSTVGNAIVDNNQVISARRVSYGPPALGRSLILLVTDSYDDITRASNQTLQQLGVALVFLVLLSLAVGLWLARRITEPIARLAHSVRGMNVAQAHIDLPRGLPAEAGELADAFDEALSSLRRRSDELAARNEELQQFAFIASHDLQEPVRTISSFSELLAAQHAEQIDERGQQFLRFVIESSARMRQLIRGLLEYSRLGREAVPVSVDLEVTLSNIRDDMDTTLAENGARLEVGELPTLTLYALEIRLLFQNLIVNAVKYRHPERDPVVRVTARRDGRGWEFAVADNGLGIAEEHRERIFLIFQRLHARQKYDGTGIGLAHCRKIVGMHGGRIWVEEEPDGGSIFKFWIEEADSEKKTQTRTAGR